MSCLASFIYWYNINSINYLSFFNNKSISINFLIEFDDCWLKERVDWGSKPAKQAKQIKSINQRQRWIVEFDCWALALAAVAAGLTALIHKSTKSFNKSTPPFNKPINPINEIDDWWLLMVVDCWWLLIVNGSLHLQPSLFNWFHQFLNMAGGQCPSTTNFLHSSH